MTFSNKISFKDLLKFSLVCSIITLLQSCTVYRGSSVSLEEAVEENTKVVVVTANGNKLKFKKLESRAEHSIGLVKEQRTKEILNELGFNFEKNGNLSIYNLDSLEIVEIYPKNKTATTFVNIGIIILSVATILAVAGVAIIFSSWGG